MNFEKLHESEYADFFSEDSLLPNSDRRPYIVKELEAEIKYNPKNDVAKWIKTYEIHKIKDHIGTTNDIWWEVTGCPDGTFTKAHNGYPNSSLAQKTFLDKNNNLVHVIDIGEPLEVDKPFKLTTIYETKDHVKENKILHMEELAYFRKSLFRYDYGSSMPIGKMKWTFSLEEGTIKQAWPKTISNVENNKVVYKKDNLRIREIFTPLIQIEHGSKMFSVLQKATLSFVLGVACGLFANYITVLINKG